MRTIRWGMIGCGAVTEVKSGPGFYKAKNSTLLGVYSPIAGQGEDYAKRHGVPKVYSSIEEMMEDAEVDAVYVATPPAFHKKYALMCAQYGKVAYVEKPMADRYEECREIIEACKLAGTPLYVAFYRRAMERFLKIKELVDTKAVGEVRSVHVTLHQSPEPEDYNKEKLPWRLLPHVAGGGKCLDMGIHTMDILDFVFGSIEEVHGIAGNQGGLYEVDDIVTATWRFTSGVQGTGNWCFTCFESLDNVEIVGSKGKIWFEFFSDKSIFLKTVDGVQEFNYPNPQHVQQPFIQSIVDELNGTSICPGDAESAARTTKVMDKILESYRKAKGF